MSESPFPSPGPMDPEFEHLAFLGGAHTAFQLLWAGVEIGVFAFLARRPGSTKVEIAKEFSLAPQPATILLTGLAALGLVVKSNDTYRNSHMTERFCLRDNPDNLIDLLSLQYHINYTAATDTVESFEFGTNVGLQRIPGPGNNIYQRLGHDPKLEKIFHDGLAALTRSANAKFAELEELRSVRHLVDIGGGHGRNAIPLAKAFPEMSFTLFDLPPVCQRAARNIAEAGLSARIKVHPGHLLMDPFPTGGDALLFAHTLSLWSPEKNVALLKKAHAALPPGGRVILFSMMADDDDSGPIAAALGSLYFLVLISGEGMIYSAREYSGFLAAAGFRTGKPIPFPMDHQVLIAEKI